MSCAVDSDCGHCGLVCAHHAGSTACVPAAGGDSGFCIKDADCPCGGQVCAASACTLALGAPDGGVARCANDTDCGACGWVCAGPQWQVCVPAVGGNPGSCVNNGDCACPGQTCSGGSCTPAFHRQCSCNDDCPSGEVCDQLLFACHSKPTSCDLSHPGECGCGASWTNGCCAQWFPPPECITDIDCDHCETGWKCTFVAGQPTPTCQEGSDVGPCGAAGASDAGGDAGTRSVGSSCGTTREDSNPATHLLAALAMLMIPRRVHRRTRRAVSAR